MRNFFDPPEPPGPLTECGDLYDYFERAVFFEGRRSGPGAEAGQQLFAVWQADMEIQNGGIAQFLFNSSGGVAEDALAGFETFALAEIGELLREAIESLGIDEIPENDDERRLRLAKALGPPTEPAKLQNELRLRMRPFDDRYFALRAEIDEEGGGQGVYRRICTVIELHRDDMFPHENAGRANS